MNRREAVSFGHKRQTFHNSLLRMVTPIENGANSFDEGVLTGFALKALGTSLGATETPNVAWLDLGVIRALRIPAEGARMNKVVR
jgi:hypothetical protein